MKMKLSLLIGAPTTLGLVATAFAGLPANAFQTLNVSYVWTGSEAVQGTTRLIRTGGPSVAGTQKPFPGLISSNPTYFYLQAFQVMPGTIVTVTQRAGNSASSFSALYSGDITFDPNNLAAGYLGDPGSSAPLLSFQVDATSSGKMLFVGNSVGGSGAIGQLLDVEVTYEAPGASSVPGPLPLFGAATAFGFSRRLRKRCNSNVVSGGKASASIRG